MKLGYKIAIGVLCVPFSAFAAGAVYLFGFKPTKRPAPKIIAPMSKEEIEHGRYLADAVYQCVWCHSPIDLDAPGGPIVEGKELSGRDWTYEAAVEQVPSFKVHAPNISSHESGIGTYSDGELVRAMREGIKKDGSGIFEFMPYPMYHDFMSDEDAIAIAAFLKASKPQSKPTVPMGMPFMGEVMGRRLPPKPVLHPYPGPPTSEKGRGEWLLRVALCHFCHDRTDENGWIQGKELGGGHEIKLPGGNVSPPNISSDPAFGIGTYSEDELVRVLSEGIGKSGKPLRFMPWTRYAAMTPEDKHAIAVALKASPPVQ